MVHARYGSKDAILDAIFMREYMAQLSPDLDPDGQRHATRARTSRPDRPARRRGPRTAAGDVRRRLRGGEEHLAAAPALAGPARRRHAEGQGGTRKGIADGSVRPDVDIECAVNDISAAVFGIAYLWLVLSEGYDLGHELKSLRERLIRDYGSEPVRNPAGLRRPRRR